jgi:MSHA biogenesis protein MshJ
MTLNVRAMTVNVSTRFTAMSLRERGLVFAALLAVLIVVWDSLLMKPLEQRKQALNQELQSVQENITQLASSLSGDGGGDSFTTALTQQQSLQQSLAAVDGQLQTLAAELIPPPRMVAALRDVLDHQQGLRLISLKNLPSYSLAPADPGTAAASAASISTTTLVPVSTTGPFVHPIEMIVEGDYLTVLNYLRAVEQLKWRFYWLSLDLNSTDYPKNRVRIMLNSLSMDRDWLGV